MKTESAVLACFAKEIAKRISKKVILALHELKDASSSGDNGLESIWEEICAQVQLEHTSFWGQYEGLLGSLITKEVHKLREHELLSLWFQSNDGVEWLDPDRTISIEEEESETPPVLFEVVARYIANTQLYEIADVFTNRNIEAYLKRFEEEN